MSPAQVLQAPTSYGHPTRQSPSGQKPPPQPACDRLRVGDQHRRDFAGCVSLGSADTLYCESLLLRIAIVALAFPLICYVIYRREAGCMSRHQALALVLVLVLLTAVVNFLHRATVDVDRQQYFTDITNVQWQMTTQNAVINLLPGALPHSYRFLPNGIVRWMELWGIGYPWARDLYRMIFGLLLFYALYRFARLYADALGSLLAMLLTALIYPVSFQLYAGQLTDPLSHLSFLLCFIFLPPGNFAAFLTAMLIGSFAKETVLAMAGYYVLFCRGEKNYPAKAIAASAGSILAYFAVRLFVLHGSFGYTQISGTTPEDVVRNAQIYVWLVLLLLTVGALLPFVTLGWKDTAKPLKRLAIFLFPVLFVSSIMFSLLNEARNFMPLVFVLAVAAGSFFSRVFTSHSLESNSRQDCYVRAVDSRADAAGSGM